MTFKGYISKILFGGVEIPLISINDLGVRIMSDQRKCPSGAVRDNSAGKGRMDLLPIYALESLQVYCGGCSIDPQCLLPLSRTLENGATHYAARNWEKGMYLEWFIDSGLRHFCKACIGWDDEAHIYAAMWNYICLIDTLVRIDRGLSDREYKGYYENLGSFECEGMPEDVECMGINELVDSVMLNTFKFMQDKGRSAPLYDATLALMEIASRFSRARNGKLDAEDLGPFADLVDIEEAGFEEGF